jgi:hypothetical protein
LKSYLFQLLSCSANLKYETGDYSEATRINKQIIEKIPVDYLTGMNLAFCRRLVNKLKPGSQSGAVTRIAGVSLITKVAIENWTV